MKSTRLYLITGLLTVLFVTCTTTQHATNGNETTGAPAFWESADSLTSTCNAALERTRNLQRQARDASEPNESSVLKPYNDMVESFERTVGLAQLVANVHPDERVRKLAEGCERNIKALATEVNLDRPLYDAVLAVPEEGLDAQAKRFRMKVLREFRLAGVDKDEPTRKRLKEIQEELVKVGQSFDRNIREDVRSIKIDPADLAGLPEDFASNHKPGEDGKVTITTNYPDYIPVQTYADKEEVRRKIAFEFLNRGHPKNDETLKRILILRNEQASLLGYPNWADYKAQDKMARSAEAIQSFTEQVADIARPRSKRDLETLLARKKKDDPKAKSIEAWDRFFYVGKVRSEEYGFDSQKVRPYFEYQNVRQGILDLYADLFEVTFERREGMSVWDDSVEVFDMMLDGKQAGRFYLDMHPRKDKYGHAAMFPMVIGLPSRQIPEAALVCNFPDPKESPAGALMEHTQVLTFFHEFGHLIHHLLGASSDWANLSGINVEWDFVEAPSQILEEWGWDPDVLGRFARHYKTGEAIPREMVAKMRGSSDFGKGVHIMRQVFYTALSFYLHTQNPQELKLSEFSKEMQQKYSPYPVIDGTHIYAGFGHLEGYSSMYYTYQWSLTLAKDIFTKFKTAGLLDRTTAIQYRDMVLRPGGTKDAAELVKDFLGRPYNLDAYKAWLEAAPTPTGSAPN